MMALLLGINMKETAISCLICGKFTRGYASDFVLFFAVNDRANSLLPHNSSSTEPIFLHEHFLERTWLADGSLGVSILRWAYGLRQIEAEVPKFYLYSMMVLYRSEIAHGPTQKSKF
jgi:hypothetical protein